jgi:hypothetical protein
MSTVLIGTTKTELFAVDTSTLSVHYLFSLRLEPRHKLQLKLTIRKRSQLLIGCLILIFYEHHLKHECRVNCGFYLVYLKTTWAYNMWIYHMIIYQPSVLNNCLHKEASMITLSLLEFLIEKFKIKFIPPPG